MIELRLGVHMKKILVVSSLLLLAAPLAAAPQAKPAAPPAKAAPAAPASPLEKGIQETLRRISAGDKAGALQQLQAVEKDPAANTPQIRSLVGALYLQLDRPVEALTILKPLADSESAEPAVLYNAGRASLTLGRIDEGRVYLTRSVILEPDSPAARDLGMLTAHEGRVVEAYSMLRPWSLRNPADADARLVASNLAVQLERPDDALELLKGMSESDPALRLVRGKALILKKDAAGALAQLQPVMANHPPAMDLEVRRTVAEAQLLAGKPAETIKLLQGKTEAYPAVALLMARAQRQAGDAAGATATLKPLADKLPENAAGMGDPRPASGIALEYGSLLMAAGRGAEALPFLEKATRYYPRNVEAWKALARALEAAGRKDDARQALAKADEAAKPPVKPAAPAPAARQAAAAPAPAPSAAPAGPAEPPLSPGLQNAMRLLGEGQLDQALAAARQEAGASKDPRARMLEVRILLAMKKFDDAFKTADAAVKAEPQNADYLYLRGATEMALQRMSSAESDLRKTLDLSPRHLPAMNDLAVLLINLGKKPEAQKLLEQVLKINPQDRMAAVNLDRLKAGMGTTP
ncbi:MAG: tetratricopeptide repeat protein [Thermoanaerobaculia bacterium]